jgi:cyclic lactone autoinducer peptide
MIKSKETAAKIAKIIAEKALKRDANSTTCAAIYQPKAPAKLKNFKKSANNDN